MQTEFPRRPVQVLVHPVRKRDHEWEFLLRRRVPEKGGFWQGVSGCALDNEELFNAAKRELLEETEFLPKWIEPIDYSYSCEILPQYKELYDPKFTHIMEHVFVALVSEDAEPRLSHEHDQYSWGSFESALKLLTTHLRKEALRKAYSFMSKKLPE